MFIVENLVGFVGAFFEDAVVRDYFNYVVSSFAVGVFGFNDHAVAYSAEVLED